MVLLDIGIYIVVLFTDPQPMGMGMSGGFMPMGDGTPISTASNFPAPSFQQQMMAGMSTSTVPSASSLANMPGSRMGGGGIIDPNSATLNQLVGANAASQQQQQLQQLPGMITGSQNLSLGGIEGTESAQQLFSNLSGDGFASNTSDILRMLTESTNDIESTDLEKLLAGEGMLDFAAGDINGQGVQPS